MVPDLEIVAPESSRAENRAELGDADDDGSSARLSHASRLSRGSRAARTGKSGASNRSEGSGEGAAGAGAEGSGAGRQGGKRGLVYPRADTERAKRLAVSEEDALMQNKFEVIRQRHQREVENARRVAQIQSEMRGKDYTFDSEGNIIVVKKSEVDRLPSRRVNPKVAIKPSAAEQAELDRLKKLGSRAPARRKVEIVDDLALLAERSFKEPKGAPKYKKKEEVFKPHQDWQPSAVQTMNLSMGVTVREGNQAKAGPGPVEDPRRMTKESYNSMSLGGGTLTSMAGASTSMTGTAQREMRMEALAQAVSAAVADLPPQPQEAAAKPKGGAGAGAEAQAPAAKQAMSASRSSFGHSTAGPGLTLPPNVHQTKERQGSPDHATRKNPLFVHQSRPHHLGNMPEARTLVKKEFGFHPKDDSKVNQVNPRIAAKLVAQQQS